MGKSDKKYKSDRINALRKQYDAFLEEDKKRKERNEYILGRLDKMRYCTAMVPVRQTNIFVDRKDILSPPLRQPVLISPHSLNTSNIPHQNLTLDVPKRPTDDIILQEISKKYILIPKCVTNPDIKVQPIKQTTEDNTDWKSKYDILEQLKRDEKETDILPNKNECDENINTNPSYDKENYKMSTAQEVKIAPSMPAYGHELRERDKDSSYRSQEGVKEIVQNEQHQTYQTYVDPTTTEEQPNHEDILPEKLQENEYYNFADNNIQSSNQEPTIFGTMEENSGLQIESNSHLNTFEEQPAHFEVNYNNENEIEGEYPAQSVFGVYDNQYVANDDEKDKITDSEKQINQVENETAPVEVISPNDLVDEINTYMPIEESPHVPEDTEYPIDTINVQDYTPADHVELHDGVNVNPDYPVGSESYNPTYQFDPNAQTVAEHSEEPVDTTGIEAFEAEQKEMFYNEEPDESYAYNSEAVVNNYENTNYDQDLTVQNPYPNEESVYYEGGEPGKEYPINEHEEASQRYDPNYEQQYDAAYAEQEYHQQQYDQDAQQQYQPENIEHTQQGMEQLHFEEQPFENPEQLEQQLDSEQGFNSIQKEDIKVPIENRNEKQKTAKPSAN